MSNYVEDAAKNKLKAKLILTWVGRGMCPIRAAQKADKFLFSKQPKS